MRVNEEFFVAGGNVAHGKQSYVSFQESCVMRSFLNMFVALMAVVAILSVVAVPGVARAASIELLTNGDLELPHSGAYPDSMGVQPDGWTAVGVGAPGLGWVHYTGYAPYIHTGSYSEALNQGNYIYQITSATAVRWPDLRFQRLVQVRPAYR